MRGSAKHRAIEPTLGLDRVGLDELDQIDHGLRLGIAHLHAVVQATQKESVLLIERVKDRRRKIAQITQNQVTNPDLVHHSRGMALIVVAITADGESDQALGFEIMQPLQA